MTQMICGNNSKGQSNATNTIKANSVGSSLDNKDTKDSFGEYDEIYDYRGSSPFNIEGTIELNTHGFSEDQKLVEVDLASSTPSSVGQDRVPFDNFAFSTARLSFTLQNVVQNYKYGLFSSLSLKPGKFEVEQTGLFIKNYFPSSKIKLSMKAGYIFGAEKRMETLAHGVILKNCGLYAFPEYFISPNVSTSPKLGIDSGKALKISAKAKKLINKDNNLVLEVSYAPKVPNTGLNKFKSDDVDYIKNMNAYLGVGLKIRYKVRDFDMRTSITLSNASRSKKNDVLFNSVRGLMFGHNMMCNKKFGFGFNTGFIFNKNVKVYSDDFMSKIETPLKAIKNIEHVSKNGGGVFVISPAISFVLSELNNTEVYLSYMHSRRKTEFISNNSNIFAKSHVFSIGCAVPYKACTIGANMHYIYYKNDAFQGEQIINATLHSKKSYTSLADQESDSKFMFSVFMKMKVARDVSTK
ncbi:MAG: hypothetical protein H6845_02575 [Alphaproteobacteria bacterium]|nr:MAG: hypothetical protein H6845_02575 [Alphaproteobacteria bacterium]